KVHNDGQAAGLTGNWIDAVIASPDTNPDNAKAVLVQRFPHTGGLAPSQSNTQTQAFLMPPGFTGRYHLFVKTDADNQVFENGAKANNSAESAHLFDVMPVAYADLIVSSVTPAGPAYGGQPLTVTWTVGNQVIGTTPTGDWNDIAYLATNADGSGAITGTETRFEHLGHLAVGDSYERT